MVAPLPDAGTDVHTDPNATDRRRRCGRCRRSPVPTPSATAPSESADRPARTETVVYDRHRNGRAINITYVDTGGLLQTEFNVVLPWSKEVELARAGRALRRA